VKPTPLTPWPNLTLLSALRAKRAEIAGHIHDIEKKLARYRVSLASIDATIRVFSPELDPDAIPPKRTYRRTRYFSKGELSRRCLDVLRKADGKPMPRAEWPPFRIKRKG
jgi:hypothetical protein